MTVCTVLCDSDPHTARAIKKPDFFEFRSILFHKSERSPQSSDETLVV